MIVVTGPTGNVGHHLIDDLLAMRASVRALVRSPDSARASVSSDIEPLIGRPARSFADFVTAHRDRLTTAGAGAAR